MNVPGHDPRMRGVLVACFGAIAVIVAFGYLMATLDANRARDAARSGVTNAFDSVALVSQMARDLARERLLVDRHIGYSKQAEMQRAATAIADTDRDLDAAAAAYRPLVLLPDEERVWRRVEADITALRPAVGDAVALSTQNRDVEAHERLAVVDDRFARVNDDLARLIDINRRGGLDVVARADAMQRMTNLRSGVLAAVAIALVVGVAAFALALVGRRERAMLAYAARLEEQNRELDAFAGRVAHDLRGPLTAMSMAVSRLPELGGNAHGGNGAGPPVLKRSIHRMERVIHDLLSLSQIEAQSRGAFCDPASVATVVRDELARTSGEAKARATLRVDVEPARVHGCEGLLVEALTNLTDNATKYARPDVAPEIAIVGRVRDGRYELSVSDNGMGMSPEEVEQAFTPFFRARRLAKAPGTGLGLSIVKRVAEVSGGSVTLVSTLGSGSTFVLRLPLAEARDVG